MTSTSESSAQPGSSEPASPPRPNTDATTQTLLASDPTLLETRKR